MSCSGWFSKALYILKEVDQNEKTDVSKVMELATKLGVKVQFIESNDLNWSQGFKSQVIFGDISISGCGSSKKEAKQNAAHNLIQTIYEKCNKRENESNKKLAANKSTSLSSPKSDSLADSVSELQIYGQRRGWDLPIYEWSSSGEKDNCKTFSCTVSFHGWKCHSIGSNKKMAKKNAATEMLKYIEDHIDQIEETPSKLSVHDESFDDGETSLVDSSEIDDYDSSTSNSASLEDISDDVTTMLIGTETALDKLESKSSQENFQYEFISLPNKNKKDLYQVFLKLVFTNIDQPPVVTHGTGKTERIAKASAAQRGLKHLDVIMAQP